MTNVFFPRTRLRCLPGKEPGKFARYDDDGLELVYIGFGDMVMHRHVLDKIDAEWNGLFSHGTGSTAT